MVQHNQLKSLPKHGQEKGATSNGQERCIYEDEHEMVDTEASQFVRYTEMNHVHVVMNKISLCGG